MARNYILQRALTGEFLDWDLPLKDDRPEWGLSGADSLTGTVAADVASLRDENGRPVLEEWGTYIYEEVDGVIRWGGVLVSVVPDEQTWAIEAAGFSSYPHGIPYSAEFSRIGIDPVDAVKEIWSHLQSYPNGKLGITVVGDNTPVRLGRRGDPAFTEVFLDGLWQPAATVPPGRIVPDASAELATDMSVAHSFAVLDSLNGLTLAEDGSVVPVTFYGGVDDRTDRFRDIPLPFKVKIGAEIVHVTGFTSVSRAEDGSYVPASFYHREPDPNALIALLVNRGIDGTVATRHFKGTNVTHEGTRSRLVPAEEDEPYLLAWWEAPDCGQEIDDLATSTPFDWRERHRWADDRRETVIHEIVIGYPRLGRRREDIRFIEGANIGNVVTFRNPGDDFANEVAGIGSGEGRTTLRRTTAVADGRLRRTAVLSDKAVSDGARLDALIRAERLRRRGLLSITSMDVIDHPNAPLGEWEPGDDVLVTADVPSVGEVSIWSRILGWTRTGENTANLTLTRSDVYRYGG